MKISVVIPMFNEEKSCVSCLDRIGGFLSGLNTDFEIIPVNDGSGDGTGEIITGYAKDKKYINPVSYADNRGKGSAVREGVLAADGDVIVVSDCDIAYGTAIISEKILPLLEEYDIAVGSRVLDKEGYRKYTLKRKAASHGFRFFVHLLTPLKYTDTQCGIKGYRRDAAKKIFSNCRDNGFAFDVEALMLADKFGFRVKEFPAAIEDHNESRSKVGVIRNSVKMLREIFEIKKNVKNTGDNK